MFLSTNCVALLNSPFHLFAEGIVSYSIPKGVQRGMEVDLSDKTYDGNEQGDRYVDGLGQLVDGQKGKDNFRTDIHGFGKGKSILTMLKNNIKFI